MKNELKKVNLLRHLQRIYIARHQRTVSPWLWKVEKRSKSLHSYIPSLLSGDYSQKLKGWNRASVFTWYLVWGIHLNEFFFFHWRKTANMVACSCMMVRMTFLLTNFLECLSVLYLFFLIFLLLHNPKI